MDLINITIAVVLILNILLAFFIYKNNRKALVNRSYILVIVTILFVGISQTLKIDVNGPIIIINNKGA